MYTLTSVKLTLWDSVAVFICVFILSRFLKWCALVYNIMYIGN